MARKPREHHSLIYQVTQKINSMTRYGQSKYQDKKKGIDKYYIYSYSTRDAYLKHSCDFVRWCRDIHGYRELDECRQYAAAYISMLEEKGQSPSTLKLKASAVAKLYTCTTKDLGIVTPDRRRTDITRSRGVKKATKISRRRKIQT